MVNSPVIIPPVASSWKSKTPNNTTPGITSTVPGGIPSGRNPGGGNGSGGNSGSGSGGRSYNFTYTVVVQAGDSFWSITQRVFGNGAMWQEVQRQMGVHTIHPGQRYTIRGTKYY